MFDFEYDSGAEQLADDDHGVPTFTVCELTDAVNGVLRRQFTDGVWVVARSRGGRSPARTPTSSWSRSRRPARAC
jgi:hypothetical protein